MDRLAARLLPPPGNHRHKCRPLVDADKGRSGIPRILDMAIARYVQSGAIPEVQVDHRQQRSKERNPLQQHGRAPWQDQEATY